MNKCSWTFYFQNFSNYFLHMCNYHNVQDILVKYNVCFIKMSSPTSFQGKWETRFTVNVYLIDKHADTIMNGKKKRSMDFWEI